MFLFPVVTQLVTIKTTLNLKLYKKINKRSGKLLRFINIFLCNIKAWSIIIKMETKLFWLCTNIYNTNLKIIQKIFYSLTLWGLWGCQIIKASNYRECMGHYYKGSIVSTTFNWLNMLNLIQEWEWVERCAMNRMLRANASTNKTKFFLCLILTPISKNFIGAYQKCKLDKVNSRLTGRDSPSRGSKRNNLRTKHFCYNK